MYLRTINLIIAFWRQMHYTEYMAEKTDNIVLEHLRYMRRGIDDIREDIRDVKLRLTHVEENLAMMNRRMDRVESRLERIEKRLDLVDA
jgi:chromosome segregation ATPase